MNLGTNESGFSEEPAILMYFKVLVHRLSRHAIMYNGDLRTSSTAVLDRPMSASRWSSSSRSCLHWYRRSHPCAIPASHASGIFQNHLRSGDKGEAASRLLVELQIVLPQDMFHLRNGAKQRLAAGAHRAVVNGPSAFCITPTFGAQAIVSGQAERVSSSGQSRHCGCVRRRPEKTLTKRHNLNQRRWRGTGGSHKTTMPECFALSSGSTWIEIRASGNSSLTAFSIRSQMS
jgi:hypothetical protein